jgi:diguanylate cyclase (GGDEF)-like protein/PAS domain S-box-containing protein
LKRTRRRAAGPPGLARRTAFSLGAGLGFAGVLLWLLAAQITSAAEEGRHNIENRTANRIALARQFTDAYLTDLHRSIERQAGASLSGPEPTAEDLAEVAVASQFRLAMLTDDRGRAIHTVPSGPQLTGADMTGYPTMAEALAGRRGVSAVIDSPLDGEDVVALSVPLETGQGRRVLAGGFVVGDTPLADFLRSSNVIEGQRTYLVDANGVIVAGGDAGADARLDEQDPELAAATAGGAAMGSFADRDQEAVFFADPLRNAPWRIVSSVPSADLYRLLERDRTAPWIVFGAFAATALAGVFLLTSLLRQRFTLSSSNQELEGLTGSLAHRSEQLRRVIDTAGDAFVAMSEDGAVTGWNAQAVVMFGWTAKEAVGQPLHELIIPEAVRSAHVEGVDRFLRTGEGPVLGQRLELEAIRKGGAALPVEVSIWALAGSDGWEFNALLRDISERRRQQADLVDREELLRLTQENAAVGMALVDLDGRWLQVNRALCGIVGRTADELLTMTFADVAHPPDVDYTLMFRLLAGEIPDFEIEGRCVRPDGSLVWCQLHVSLLRQVGGADRLIFQVLDVDERHRHEERLAREVSVRLEAEQAARRERDFLAVVLAAVDEGYVYTVDGVIRDVNDRLCALTGFAREELVGCPRPYPFWAPGDAARFTEISATLQARGGGDLEVELVRRDGERFPVALAIRPAGELAGDADGLITIVTDLTAIKQREGRLLDIAARDPLTGLFNRRAIDDNFSRLRTGDAVVVLDLDHFKRINDTFGHAAGDSALTSLAQCISANLRPGDWAGRLGGEEFIILVQGGGHDGASSVVSRLREAWAGSDPLTTFSAGIAVHEAGAESRQTLAQADEAMYVAKNNGRNRTEVFAGAAGPQGGP